MNTLRVIIYGYIYIYGNVVVICSNMVIIVEAGSRGLFLCAAFG